MEGEEKVERNIKKGRPFKKKPLTGFYVQAERDRLLLGGRGEF